MLVPAIIRLIALAFLPVLQARAAGAGETALRDFVEKNERRQAYGVYVKKRKFGWAVDELKRGQLEGKEVAISTFEMQGSFTSAGETTRFQDRSVSYFALEGTGEIIRGEDHTVEDGNETIRVAVREGDSFTITTRSRGGETQRSVPVPRETISLMRELERWLTKPPKKGAQFQNYSTAWNEEKVDSKELFTFRGKKSLLWGGVKTAVYLVNVNIEGMVADFEVLADGTPVKGMLGGLFELQAEKEAVAKMPGTEPFDMLQASSIPLDRNLGDPEELASLTLRITGLGRFALPVSHRQRIRSRFGKSLILELSPDRPIDQPAVLAPAQRQEYLRPTSTIQSDHAALRGQARKIIGDASDVLEKSRRLEKWVFSNVRQTMAANTSLALDVLNNRAGDCTEITLLFVTLARAAGIPAREVGGVMYANEEAPLLGWHAWAEIHDGHQWISIDPTWDQVYVDAAHIKLSNDSNDWGWVNLLGRVKVKVVNFTKKHASAAPAKPSGRRR